MTDSQQDIKYRIQGRELAEEVIDLASDGSEAFRKAFALHVRKFADLTLGAAPTELRTMNDSEANDFENSIIKYGVHRGLKFREVPMLYLTWIADSNLNLLAYLRSDIGKKRIEEQE